MSLFIYQSIIDHEWKKVKKKWKKSEFFFKNKRREAGYQSVDEMVTLTEKNKDNRSD